MLPNAQVFPEKFRNIYNQCTRENHKGHQSIFNEHFLSLSVIDTNDSPFV